LKSAGAACNDGNACTLSDACNSSGICVGSPKACNSPPGQCYESTGTCSDGACSYAPKYSGAACSDNNVCWLGDSCDGQGTCVGGDESRSCPHHPEYCLVSKGCSSSQGCIYESRCGSNEVCDRGQCCPAQPQLVSQPNFTPVPVPDCPVQ
jgi:hypothetical protein